MNPVSRRWPLVAIALLAILLAAHPALAQTTTSLADPVTDSADVLSSGQEADLEAELDERHDATGVQLWVLFLDSLGGSTAPELAEDTAASNGLGGDDALLLVAFTDRAYALWVPEAMTGVSDAEIDSILTERVEPALRDDDPVTAALGAADGLAAAIGANPTTAPTNAPATPAPTAAPGGGTGGSGGGVDLILVIAIVVIGGGAFLLFRSLRKGATTTPPATPAPGRTAPAGAAARGGAAATTDIEAARLRRESTAALVEVDEALRDAETELAEAEAQWGAETIRPMREAIAGARADAEAAFAIRRQVDDDQPEPAPQRAAMLREILDRSRRARTTVDAEVDRIEQLRDLEHRAPELLGALEPRVAQLETRRTAAQGVLDGLTTTYGPEAVASVAGNLVEAEKALDGVRAEIDRGRAAATAGDTRGAATALRHSEDGLAAADRLIGAVDRLATGLADASDKVGTLLEEVATDLAAARRGLAAAPMGVADDALTSRLAAAERLLAEARDLAEPPGRDPLAALERARSADQEIDAIAGTIIERSEVVRRETAALAASIASARTRVDRARDFIATRRHGVGDRARAQLAQAERLIAEAESLAPTDRPRAQRLAGQAGQAADAAYTIAAQEFDGWRPDGGPVAGPYAGTGADIAGAVLGGILGGVLSGGMRGSGWGGSPWGSPWPGRRGGRSSGGFGFPMPGGGGLGGGGGWGGGASRGGGGGRARGGRW